MPVLVRSFSYTPDVSFSEECIWSLHASFSEEFLVHSLYITDELYTLDATFS